MRHFEGYRRRDGRIGVRNRVIVMNSVAETASLTRRAASGVSEAVPVVHAYGADQMEHDREQTLRALRGNAAHPNVFAALFIGTGEEEDPAEELAEAVRECGGEARVLTLRECPDLRRIVGEAGEWLTGALERASRLTREPADASELIVGLECGGSDAWSGVTANPAVGEAADLFVEAGGTVILAETTEAIGAEHILARRAATPEVRAAFLRIIEEYEARMKASGEDYRMGNPSPGNKRGGLTTLDEKSLGCIKKAGSTPLNEVIAYAHRPTKRGFVFMDTPGYDVDSVTGLTAGGAQVVLFTTGRGSPTGSPIAPVIKVGTNSRLYRHMPQHIDVNAGVILEGKGTLKSVGREIFDLTLRVASGELAKAERLGHREFSVWRLAESL